MDQLNLFEPKGEKLVNRYAKVHGPGPEGTTCGGCNYFRREEYGEKTYFKCGLYPSTRGGGTDIRKSWPSCRRFSDREEAARQRQIDKRSYHGI